MSEVVKLERHDVIAIVTVNSPPVNALSAAVRGGILECIKARSPIREVEGDRADLRAAAPSLPAPTSPNSASRRSRRACTKC